jgi:6-phosphofructokinase 1
MILRSHIEEGQAFNTQVSMIADGPEYENTVGEEILGLFTSPGAKKAVIADMTLLEDFERKSLDIPSFLAAGPRRLLRHDPRSVRVAIVTVGGLAPGLHCVIHSIVKRHTDIYGMRRSHGEVFGVYGSYRGLCNLPHNLVALSPQMTEEWLASGGSELGIVRYFPESERGDEAATEDMVECITKNLDNNLIDILYVIGGDGSLKIAHKIALKNPGLSIVGIPKTMDNDVLWVWQSFGFDSAVEQATRVINLLHREAESTRRICLVELFGAESGSVAANASAASGHVDLVLIPEVFNLLEADAIYAYMEDIAGYLCQAIQRKPHNPHAVVVVAEGVGTVLGKEKIKIEGKRVNRDNFVDQFTKAITGHVRDAHGRAVAVFVNQPRHHIRAVPANAHDHIYCERLGALAVDNALAGYTDFMVSQWLTEYVLVPLHLVEVGQKSIPVNGMFWKQVISSTGQPLSPVEYPVDSDEQFG